MELIEKIAILRRILGWSQEVMGDELGICQTQYGKLERGEAPMTLTRLKTICSLWGVSQRQVEDLTLEELKTIIETNSRPRKGEY